MADTVIRAPVTDAIKALLNAQMAPAVGVERVDISRAPAIVREDSKGELRDGYGILYPLTSPMLWVTLGDPERRVTATYQLTWVGRNAQHVAALSDRGHAVLCARTGSKFTHVLAPVGATVLDRRCRERGTVEPGSGGLWSLPDIYDMEVQGA